MQGKHRGHKLRKNPIRKYYVQSKKLPAYINMQTKRIQKTISFLILEREDFSNLGEPPPGGSPLGPLPRKCLYVLPINLYTFAKNLLVHKFYTSNFVGQEPTMKRVKFAIYLCVITKNMYIFRKKRIEKSIFPLTIFLSFIFFFFSFLFNRERHILDFLPIMRHYNCIVKMRFHSFFL